MAQGHHNLPRLVAGRHTAASTKVARRTLGPVADLENHLPSEWWRTLFNAIYLKTDGDVVENERNTKSEVDLLINSTRIDPDSSILDLCCGQGRHSLDLAARGFMQVTGLDRSRYLVNLAKKRARRLNLTVQFHQGDARRLRFPEDAFSCVAIMGNSFGYFEREEDDVAVLKSVLRVLRPGGRVALDIVDGDWMRSSFEPRSWEWIDQNHFVCRERTLTRDGGRLVSREVVVHAEKGVIADQFYAERLYTKDRLVELLQSAGFLDINVTGQMTPQSDRNQDLGMMASRSLFVASAPERAFVSVSPTPPFPRVTVLMGDSNLPDTLKRDGKFNPEDLDTINKMKSALETLTGYTFDYSSDHAALLTRLRENPPEFVLNLCDEGYWNDARMEPHVTSYLEMLRIPYSGAGPSCLTLCYDKAAVRAIASALDIPVPLETYISPSDQSGTIPSEFPALLKPNFGDSSLGITQESVVRTPEQFLDALHRIRKIVPSGPILVQEFLEGPEYSVGILGNPGQSCTVLPVLEVDYSGLDHGLTPILGYESKWLPESPYWTQVQYKRANVCEKTLRHVQDASLLLFERLDCRDYARFDFRACLNGQVKLLEVNPNPGWCWDGKFNMMAGFAGIDYATLLKLIIEHAQRRIVSS